MREAGRASLVTIAGIVCLLLVAVLFMFNRETPATAASSFLDALARRDAARLTELTYMAEESPESIRQKWDKTLNNVSRYYGFAWRVRSHKQTSDNTAAVIIEAVPDLSNPGTYEQKFELPMVLQDGEWKVDVRGLSRTLYPGLPR